MYKMMITRPSCASHSSSASRSKRVMSSRSLLLVKALLVVLVCSTGSKTTVHAQRAAVSKGTKKMKQRKGTTTSSSAKSTAALSDGKWPFFFFRNRKKIEGESTGDNNDPTSKTPLYKATAFAATLMAVFLGAHIAAIHRLEQKRTQSSPPLLEDDEFSVDEEGHLVPKKGLERVDIAFDKVRLELAPKKGTEPRVLLDGSIHGRAKPGRMLAIMGPSGAGKSVFLHALAGRIKYNRKLTLAGERYLNGQPVDGDSMIPSAFIEQEFNFFPHMTVRETLEFRVSLKLGSVLPKNVRDDITENLMKQLGLLASADTVVGDAKVRGISGGEKKRLSIATEMISAPPVIFLDEPTSGLDSAAAASLVEKLRSLANQGKTIVAVIHQPSQHVFSMFDDLLLLSEGQQMYFGPVEEVRSYMEQHGYPAEKEVGTAEYVLECISRYPRLDESEEDAVQRIQNLAGKARTDTSQKVDLGLHQYSKKDTEDHFRITESRHGPKANIVRQFGLLLKRAMKEAFRGKSVIILKTVQQVTVGLIYGGIYKLGKNQASIQDRYGLISLTVIGAANMAIASSLRSFPKEKAIVANEIATRMYRTLPYFVGKALSELPLVAFYNGIMMTLLYKLTGLNSAAGKLKQFLSLIMMHGLAAESLGLAIGAISPNSDVALALFPAILVLNIIFDGRNISVENTPKYLRWISKIGLMRWGFEGLSLIEFEGLEFDTSGPRRGPVAKTGQDALARMGLGDRTLGEVLRAQFSITAGCWCLSFLGLALTRQKFLEMKVPKD